MSTSSLDSGVDASDISTASKHGFLDPLLSSQNESQFEHFGLDMDDNQVATPKANNDDDDEVPTDTEEPPPPPRRHSPAPSETPTTIISPTQSHTLKIITAKGIKIRDFHHIPDRSVIPPPARRNIYEEFAMYEFRMKQQCKMTLEEYFRSIGLEELTRIPSEDNVPTVPNTPVLSPAASLNEDELVYDDEAKGHDLDDGPLNHSFVLNCRSPSPSPGPDSDDAKPADDTAPTKPILHPPPNAAPPMLADSEVVARFSERQFAVPGRTLRTLLNLQWVTEDEAKARWLKKDWDSLREYDEGMNGPRPFKERFPNAEKLVDRTKFPDIVMTDGYPWIPEYPVDRPDEWFVKCEEYIKKRQDECARIWADPSIGTIRHKIFQTKHLDGTEDIYYRPGEFSDSSLSTERYIPGYRDRCTFTATYWVPASALNMAMMRALTREKNLPKKLKDWWARQEKEWIEQQKVLGVWLDDLKRGGRVFKDEEEAMTEVLSPERYSRSLREIREKEKSGLLPVGGHNQSQSESQGEALVVLSQNESQGMEVDQPASESSGGEEESQQAKNAVASSSTSGSGNYRRQPLRRGMFDRLNRLAAQSSFMVPWEETKKSVPAHLPPEMVHRGEKKDVNMEDQESPVASTSTPAPVAAPPSPPVAPASAPTTRKSRGKKRGRGDDVASSSSPPMTRRRKKMMETGEPIEASTEAGRSRRSSRKKRT